MDQKLFENKVAATIKIMYNFCYERKPSCATTNSTLFAVSKDKWDIKEDTGKSMKNASYIRWWYAAMLNSKKQSSL